MVRVSFAVCAILAVSFASAVPAQNQHQEEDGASDPGFGSVLWSVIEDCLGDGGEPASMCFKSKAVIALDRALSKPSVTLVEGLALSARSAKSLADPHAEQADHAALDATKDLDRKNTLLDDMLAVRVDRLMSTRTLIVESPDEQEGRGKKKKQKNMQQALMMVGMMAAAVMGPMAMKVIALIAAKALILSKVALVLSAIMALKKLMNQQPEHEPEHVSHHYARSIKLEDSAATQNMAYSAQQKQ